MKKSFVVSSLLFLTVVFTCSTVVAIDVKLVEQSHQKVQSDATELSELIAGALKKTHPREIIEVPSGTPGMIIKDFPFQDDTKLIKIQGNYTNTTRHATDQFYTYMWQEKCFYQNYTPSNQFMAAHSDPDMSFLDLSRFGFIGHNRICSWGLIGVQWIKPLPVWQVNTNTPQPPSKKQMIEIGVPGRAADGIQILQILDNMDDNRLFTLKDIGSGLYNLVAKNGQVLDIKNQHMFTDNNCYQTGVNARSQTQKWKILNIKGRDDVVELADASGTWCVARVSEINQFGMEENILIQKCSLNDPHMQLRIFDA